MNSARRPATVSATSPAAGRVDLVITGVDTTDAPMITVTAHSIAAVSRMCNTRALSITGASTYTARIECYDAAGNAAANTSFTFIVTD